MLTLFKVFKPKAPGTVSAVFAPTLELNGSSETNKNAHTTLVAMPAYKGWSMEELRLADYESGRVGKEEVGKPAHLRDWKLKSWRVQKTG